ncbi:hypothetical protein [Streptomyces boncukensis]|uniref:Uncharacterized protein n=1 Tax=Streptomyces boncukensis TaxID=2711219 RepID=A0A6G4WZ89_9ACTN|nr:hypothetical protein [Streptomyces boncukensis]NGO70555.1 hypothetical protein [Streptomyces boncukensis]
MAAGPAPGRKGGTGEHGAPYFAPSPGTPAYVLSRTAVHPPSSGRQRGHAHGGHLLARAESAGRYEPEHAQDRSVRRAPVTGSIR